MRLDPLPHPHASTWAWPSIPLRVDVINGRPLNYKNHHGKASKSQWSNMLQYMHDMLHKLPIALGPSFLCYWPAIGVLCYNCNGSRTLPPGHYPVPLPPGIKSTTYTITHTYMHECVCMHVCVCMQVCMYVRVVLIGKFVRNEMGAPKSVPNGLNETPPKYFSNQLIFRVCAITLNFLHGWLNGTVVS